MLIGDDRDNELTGTVITSAVEVHRLLGPGLLESACESALCRELTLRGIPFIRQPGIALFYKGELIAEHRPDLVVDKRIVVEVKAVTRFEPVHVAQVLTYLKVMNLRVGLLLNFNVAVMKHGVRRVIR